MSNDQSIIVEADPQKEFFISMIVRDIDLLSAVVDLVDNSVDAARRSSNVSLDGFRVELFLNKQTFTIKDNCGGMDAKVARERAFKFGRPDEFLHDTKSVGRFGIGMKRAIFKMGRHFNVSSTAEQSSFEIDVDVEQWKKEEGPWQFRFTKLDESPQVAPSYGYGTTVEVSELFDTVSEQFHNSQTISRLMRMLSYRHLWNMMDGLTIKVNGTDVKSVHLGVASSDEIRPEVRIRNVPIGEEAPIRLWVIAGLSKGVPEEAGWYVFCNHRMLLQADKSETTAWNKKGRTPRYHNQYSRFRGFLMFESVNIDALPWNTTKTDLDTDSFVYTIALKEMIESMYPVLRWLDELKAYKKHRGKEDEERVEIEKTLDDTGRYELFTLAKESKFSARELEVMDEDQEGLAKVAFQYDKEIVEKIKECLQVRTNREVGEKTLEYYYKYECEDE
ncbi:MAG: ATP-binding protein [Fimbriimonadaceae bacterium]|nr:ATP-binding protein [Fimbriimonadaceae bacterium]